MKVLAVSNLYPPDFLGGYELGCRQAVESLRARGHHVRVLTAAPYRPTPHSPGADRALQLTDVYDPHYVGQLHPAVRWARQAQSSFVNAFNVYALARTVEEFRPDVAYLWNLLGLGGLGLLGCLRHLGVPWVFHLMDRVPVELCCGPRERVLPPLAREFSRLFAGHFLSCSQRLLDEIEEMGVRLAGRVELLPNWVDGPPAPPRADYLRGGGLRVVAAGTLGAHKGTDLLIRAAARLRECGRRSFSVDIYGPVTDPSFEGLIRQCGLAGCVTLRGARTQAQLRQLYADYDVFAFPTWEREPFGFAPLEAAARGCVPVVSQSCGFAEWFVDRVSCLKVERSAEGFAEALAAILDGGIDLAPLGRRAAGIVARDHHIDRLVVRIEEALRRAAAGPRMPSRGAEETYRLALLAERVSQVVTQLGACG